MSAGFQFSTKIQKGKGDNERNKKERAIEAITDCIFSSFRLRYFCCFAFKKISQEGEQDISLLDYMLALLKSWKKKLLDLPIEVL